MSNGGSSSGGTTTDLTLESSDEEQEESSSSSSNDVSNTNTDLENFRQMWKEELIKKRQQQQNEKIFKKTSKKVEEDMEDTAKVLFLKGAELERIGKLYEAIQFYKRAVQLVPDIEFKVNSKSTQKAKDSLDISKELLDNSSKETIEDQTNSNGENEDLLLRIQRKHNKESYFCNPKLEQTLTHISALPIEIILYILKWVISSDLDLRSLEMLSVTCRGFYLCCRDSEIWRLVCSRMWGVNMFDLPNGFSSWRQLFIERPRLKFNGCYISKTTYIRQGEHSFQDEIYRPWHMVTYYRYLRFFPDGLVLMLTTPDEPTDTVGQLKYRTAKSTSVLSGRYRLVDDKVTLVVHRQSVLKSNSLFKKSRTRDSIHDPQQTFHLELQIQSYKKQRHVQLVWTNYSVYTRNLNGTETQCSFEIINNRFPPLWFSRVKSYSAESYSPL